MKKKLVSLMIALVSISGLNAMRIRNFKEMPLYIASQKDPILKVLAEDWHMGPLQTMLAEGTIKPNLTCLTVGFRKELSPLEVAVLFGTEKAVMILLPLTLSNELFLKSFGLAIDMHDELVNVRGNDLGCRHRILKLFIVSFEERGFDVQSSEIQLVLNERLKKFATHTPKPHEVEFILKEIGVDRIFYSEYNQFLIEDVQELADEAFKLSCDDQEDDFWEKRLKEYQKILKHLYSYAPNLKTKCIVAILDSLEKGDLPADYFQNNADLFESVGRFSKADPKMHKKWLAYASSANLGVQSMEIEKDVIIDEDQMDCSDDK